jgi:hypothetical protein
MLQLNKDVIKEVKMNKEEAIEILIAFVECFNYFDEDENDCYYCYTHRNYDRCYEYDRAKKSVEFLKGEMMR